MPLSSAEHQVLFFPLSFMILVGNVWKLVILVSSTEISIEDRAIHQFDPAEEPLKMVARLITSTLNRIRKTYSVSSTITQNYDFTPLYLPLNFQFNDDDGDSATRVSNPNFMLQKRWHTGHSHSHHDHRDLRSGKDGERIFRLGLAADIGLAASKDFTGYVCGSTVIIADAAHSISNVVLSGVALLSFKAARVPKDKEHPYGHGKFETLVAVGISGVLLATAGGIGWYALDVLLGMWSAAPEVVNQSMTYLHVHDHNHSGHHHGIDMDHPILALNVTILSIAVKEGLYWITKRAGDRVGSGLMKANAWHHRADAVYSVVALIGPCGKGHLDKLYLWAMDRLAVDSSRDAIKIAEEAEKLIIKAAPNIVHVCIQLRLGRSMPESYHELVESRSGRKDN
ncbi:hypothetical protein RND71_024667 [Anisodus tanguticus]|uniref:Cation efflux protein transmembrane domain-containing protein n=1 Tax=Anisodus tanguticus TaxID=243964 RepID=A0AAE1RQ29_9SOLA|nr:hypothetical protein RND71_024667 [Anisodus tanguticus]